MNMEDGEAPSIADVIGTAIAEDLAGVLVSLEGQVVNAGEIIEYS